MNDDKRYFTTALRAPSKGKGWEHANYASKQAALANLLGRDHGIKPEIIYNWSRELDINLGENVIELRNRDNGVLRVAVLNDWDLDKARTELLTASVEDLLGRK